jgi:chemotaxis protein histidine kinase CheA
LGAERAKAKAAVQATAAVDEVAKLKAKVEAASVQAEHDHVSAQAAEVERLVQLISEIKEYQSELERAAASARKLGDESCAQFIDCFRELCVAHLSFVKQLHLRMSGGTEGEDNAPSAGTSSVTAVTPGGAKKGADLRQIVKLMSAKTSNAPKMLGVAAKLASATSSVGGGGSGGTT